LSKIKPPQRNGNWEGLLQELAPLKCNVNSSGWIPFSNFALIDEKMLSVTKRCHERVPSTALPFDCSTFPWHVLFPDLNTDDIALIIKSSSYFAMAGGDGNAIGTLVFLSTEGDFFVYKARLCQYPVQIIRKFSICKSIDELSAKLPRIYQWLCCDSVNINNFACDDDDDFDQLTTEHAVMEGITILNSPSFEPMESLAKELETIHSDEILTLQEFNELCQRANVQGNSWSS